MEIPPAAVAAPSTLEALSRQALLDEAIDPTRLSEVLDDARFEAAAQRVSRGDGREALEVTVRRLRFASVDGAERYLRWTQDHPGDLVGTARPDGSLDGAPIFRHDVGGCCPEKDLTAYLAVMQDGNLVTTVVVRGAAVTKEDLSAAVATARGEET